MLKGKTPAEAQSMSGEELSAPLGALPPVKIHCAQLVEGALRNALSADKEPETPKKETKGDAPTLIEQFAAPKKKLKIIIDKD
jgi:hypothetical protein